MAQYLFDVNAQLYWLSVTSPFHEEVAVFVRECVRNDDALLVSASSLNETYYVLHSSLGYSCEQARDALRDISSVFDFADVTGEVVSSAIESDEPDYEDAVVRAAAEANECDAIISYDKRAFKKSPVPRFDAREALDCLLPNDGRTSPATTSRIQHAVLRLPD